MTTTLAASSFDSSTLGANARANAQLYKRTAYVPLGGTLDNPTDIGTLTTNQTQLDVTSQVTQTNQSAYYKFTLNGTNIKTELDNLTQSSTLRLQLYDSKGTLVADSQGTAAQQIAYVQLTTASGLTATAGDYTFKVSYATTALKSLAQNYSLQVYSGTTFSKAYDTLASPQASLSTTLPIDNTDVYSNYDALSYSHSAYHAIGETASGGVNIGWLKADDSALSLTSQLTKADNSEFYNFTLQQGDNLKFAFNNSTATSALRVQLYDSSGIRVLADNYGTADQQAAYKQLISSTGLSATAANYVVKVSYAPSADKTKTQTYNFQVYSGTTYNNLYTTTASAQTYANAILSGNTSVVGYSSQSAAAAYLKSFSNGDDQSADILTALGSKY